MNNKNTLINKSIIIMREYDIASVLFQNVAADLLGLNASDMQCLILLSHKGLATPSELSRYAGITSGSTTIMIDRLEKKGFIERLRNPEDRRSVNVVILDESKKQIDTLFRSARQAQEAMISAYSEKELEVLHGFFKKSVELWEQEREKTRALKKTRGGRHAKLNKKRK